MSLYRAEKNLTAIASLCENPGWTADRRWRILELAKEALQDVKNTKEYGDLGEEGVVVDE